MVDSKTLILSIVWIWPNIGGVPTYYSSYIDTCDYEGARNASQMGTEAIFKENEVHGGYFTVNRKMNANLYSLFIKSNKNWRTAPLIVWLQGQPGCTSLYAVFAQNGPYRVNDDLSLTKNEYAWTNEYNVLYLDSMVFTGYSHAGHTSNVVAYLDNIGTYLYEALFQFYQIYSNIAGNDLFISGEMYSGKYVLLLAHVIHTKNPISHVKMHLKGLHIGAGFTDPENMLEYSTYMYQIGLVDYGRMKEMQNMEESIRKSIRSGKYDIAQRQLRSVWVEMELVGFNFSMDFTQANGDTSWQLNVFELLRSPRFRAALNLGPDEPFYHEKDDVPVRASGGRGMRATLESYVLKTAKHLLPLLLDHYRVLYYGAQFDLLVPYVHIANFLRLLEWNGAEIYYNSEKSPRHKWLVDDELAGYWKTAFNLTEVLVRNSPQMIDTSRPKWGFNLLKSFVNNQFRSSRHAT